MIDSRHIEMLHGSFSYLATALAEAVVQTRQFSERYHDLMNDAVSRHMLRQMMDAQDAAKGLQGLQPDSNPQT